VSFNLVFPSVENAKAGSDDFGDTMGTQSNGLDSIAPCCNKQAFTRLPRLPCHLFTLKQKQLFWGVQSKERPSFAFTFKREMFGKQNLADSGPQLDFTGGLSNIVGPNTDCLMPE
jgi:hypothetical protein